MKDRNNLDQLLFGSFESWSMIGRIGQIGGQIGGQFEVIFLGHFQQKIQN